MRSEELFTSERNWAACSVPARRSSSPRPRAASTLSSPRAISIRTSRLRDASVCLVISRTASLETLDSCALTTRRWFTSTS
jgi:hypothetical protein